MQILVAVRMQPSPKKDTPSTSSSVTYISASSSVAEKKTRTLSVAAANRWKTASLASYLRNEWLIINADAAGNVTSLNCSVCKHFADKGEGDEKLFEHLGFHRLDQP